MRVVTARNVAQALHQGLHLLDAHGDHAGSRAGDVVSLSCPVMTVTERPTERVLHCRVRDANPFFHLFESLWMLAGRDDARWLDRFVSDFSSRFAEDSGLQWGAYGMRWRHHWEHDQLELVVRKLRASHNDRRVVIQMWDPEYDLAPQEDDDGNPMVPRDVPCNTQIYPRVVRGALDITVCCRSNDAIWGAHGANAVHFSVLQEYLAARIGVPVGRMYQLSNNYHAYKDTLIRVYGEGALPPPDDRYSSGAVRPAPMVGDPERFDYDLSRFMEWTRSEEPDQEPQEYPHNPWFSSTAEPIFVAHHFWRQGVRQRALDIVDDHVVWPDMAPDWRVACREWMARRMERT